MNDDVIDIFSRLPINLDEFNHPALPPPPRPKRPYTAYEVSEKVQFCLKFTNNSGCRLLLPYAYHTEIILSSDNNILDIVYHNARVVMLLGGKHLDQLIDPIQDRVLRSIYGFSGHAHLEPSPESTIITKVRLSSLQDYFSISKKKKEGNKTPVSVK